MLLPMPNNWNMIAAIDAFHFVVEVPLRNLIPPALNYMLLAFRANRIFIGFSVDVPNEDVADPFF